MKIVTSLSFRGNCGEAFEFYAKVLGGRITAAFPYGALVDRFGIPWMVDATQ
jgi:PhnB protein